MSARQKKHFEYHYRLQGACLVEESHEIVAQDAAPAIMVEIKEVVELGGASDLSGLVDAFETGQKLTETSPSEAEVTQREIKLGDLDPSRQMQKVN